MDKLKKLSAMLEQMDKDLGIVGDIIGAISLFLILYIGLIFVGVYQ